MSEARNQALLEGVAADPKAYAPRRVYADWWLERGDPRGEFAILSLELGGRIDPAKRKSFQAKALKLMNEHGEAWLAPLTALGATEPRVSRGFVEEISIDEAELGKHAAALLALEPITALTVELDDGRGLLQAMQTPAFDRVVRLTLRGDADALDGVLQGPLHVQSLELISLRQTGAAGVAAIAGAPGMAALQRLSLSGTEAGSAGLAAVAASGLRLRALFATRIDAQDAGVEQLVKGDLTTLEVLCLGANELTSASVRALADCAGLNRLHTLELDHNELTTAGVEVLGDVGRLPALKKLDLSGMWQKAKLTELSARLGRGLRL